MAQKAEAIAGLIDMAAVFVADQAAAFITFGASEAALPLIDEAADKLMAPAVQTQTAVLRQDASDARARHRVRVRGPRARLLMADGGNWRRRSGHWRKTRPGRGGHRQFDRQVIR